MTKMLGSQLSSIRATAIILVVGLAIAGCSGESESNPAGKSGSEVGAAGKASTAPFKPDKNVKKGSGR
jgi:hypothetical protein